MAESQLRKVLNRVRRRLLVIGGAASVCWACLAAIFVCLAGVWLDLVWELPAVWRVGVSGMACLAGAAFLALLSVHTLRSAREMSAAWHLDRAGATGGMIVSGWELAARPLTHLGPASAELTTGLARMAVEHAAHLAQQVSPAAAVSSKPARRAAVALALLVTLGAGAALWLPALTDTELRRFLYPFADVPPYSRLILEVTPGDASVVYGQGLEVHVTVLNGAAAQVELVLEPEGGEPETLPMFPQAGNQWRTALTRITVPAAYFVRADRSRSVRYQISVITVPRIETVRFRVSPPAYTREPPTEGPLPKGGLSALAGTRVVVWAQSNRPLSGGRVDVETSAGSTAVALQPTAAGSQEVSGEFDIQAAGRFQLSVTDVAQQESPERFSGSITLLADQRPLVRLTAPQPMSLATPTASLPVAIAAEDDYGIARAQLFRSLNNSRPLPLNLRVASPPARRWQEQLQLPLSDYGLSPGDEIKLFARVEDNDPAGAKGAETAVATVRIISQQDFERMLQVEQGLEALLAKYESAERQMDELLEQLQALEQELAAADPNAPATEQLRQRVQELAAQARQSAAAIRQSAEHRLPYDLDENLREQLRRMAEELDEAATALKDAASAAETPNERLAKQIGAAMQRLKQNRQQFQQDAMEPLEHLALIYPLIEDQSRFVALVLQQRDLAERLASLKNVSPSDDPALEARARELEQEQRALREELAALLIDIETHVQQLPADPQFDRLRQTATEFVVAVRNSGAAEAMAGAEVALAELAGTRAWEEARRAAEILESFLSRCEGMNGQCRGCLAFHPGLCNSLGNTVEQLLAQAGFGQGSGAGGGDGIGAGYSARRSGQGQVGLYGGLPGMMGMTGGQGRDRQMAARGRPGVLTGPLDADAPSLYESAAHGDAVGGGEGMIPAGYRQRVAQYFLRITEETH